MVGTRRLLAQCRSLCVKSSALCFPVGPLLGRWRVIRVGGAKDKWAIVFCPLRLFDGRGTGMSRKELKTRFLKAQTRLPANLWPLPSSISLRSKRVGNLFCAMRVWQKSVSLATAIISGLGSSVRSSNFPFDECARICCGWNAWLVVKWLAQWIDK